MARGLGRSPVARAIWLGAKEGGLRLLVYEGFRRASNRGGDRRAAGGVTGETPRRIPILVGPKGVALPSGRRSGPACDGAGRRSPIGRPQARVGVGPGSIQVGLILEGLIRTPGRARDSQMQGACYPRVEMLGAPGRLARTRCTAPAPAVDAAA